MSITVTVDSAFFTDVGDHNNDGVVSLSDYFSYLSSNMGFSPWDLFDSFNGNTGWLLGPKNGTQFGLESNTGSGAAFVASAATGGELHYTLFDNPTHTFYGDLNTIEVGSGLNDSGSVWSTSQSWITFDNLSSVLGNGTVNGQPQPDNELHNIIYSLMQGDGEALQDFLVAQGYDLDAALSVGVQSADAALVGVQEYVDDLALAA
ncbi:hypothetical protein HW090_11635 [Pseudomonas sp. ABC1]|uniref:heme acquisition protein HasA n=1 Tax=Pseudomonas sp. ABC1 TaxID=2748080 RepID=UPI0015C2C6B7|nr:heme acquisition protein HasA [Pseudomonas sp. ABC1]QLF93813.1 hypothetical protein HW090_11635 [Pseudomonas sp. ABC1]